MMSSKEESILCKREQRENAIPSSWKLNSAIYSSFQLPLESSNNNIVSSGIIPLSNILSEKEIWISESCNAVDLVQALASGELTAMEVTIAFSKRAAIAHQVTNCLTEIFFDTAMERANELDKIKQEGRLCGPLHGLPISLKDSFQISGLSSTLGLTAYLDQISLTNTPVVTILLDLGAVLYCKTNVPQLLMAGESDNVVFGRTLNPHNTSLTAGGSSGGEGALVAMRGSPIGLGTDLAGSIRVPALCCGTYGFRPTAHRLPHGGLKACYDAYLPHVAPCIGPLANDIKSLSLLVKAIIDARPALYDATVLDVGWRQIQNLDSAKLRFGIVGEDPKLPLHPPVGQTLSEAACSLEAQGHEVVRLGSEECGIAMAAEIFTAMLSLDEVAGNILSDVAEEEVPSVRRVTGELAKFSRGAVAELDNCSDYGKLSGLHRKKAQYAASWNKVWKTHCLDAIISPVAQCTAIGHDKMGPLPYTEFLNLLDYPACSIPFGKAEGSRLEGGFELKSGQVGPPYDPETVSGAPCGIQIFTRRMLDEECLKIAEVVDESFRTWLSDTI